MEQSSLNDVFRFTKIRIPDAANIVIKLLETQTSSSFQQLSPTERRARADRSFNRENEILNFMNNVLTYGRIMEKAIRDALEMEDATLRNVFELLSNGEETIRNGSFQSDLTYISDRLLVYLLSSKRSPHFPLIKKLFLVYYYLRLSIDFGFYLDMPLKPLTQHSILPPFDSAPNGEGTTAKISSVGIADLMVVKQHIKRYEATEIAHIENIMSGETRRREHRNLDRIEETFISEKESTVEKETELQTTERFELDNEVSKTIKEDQKYGFDLSISASYGPTFQVESGFEMELSTSTETTAKSASKYAKDVMERSLERVKERVREERIRKIIRETEEKNLHEFKNESVGHKTGIYQFVDKIYEAQVFNYGKRQILDIMVPEPASYLWYLTRNKEDFEKTLPDMPPKLEISALDILHNDKDKDNDNHYAKLGQKYGAKGLTPPPESKLTVTGKIQQPAAGAGASDEIGDRLSPPVVIELDITDGYAPRTGTFHCISMSDNNNARKIPFSFGSKGGVWPKSMAPEDVTTAISANSIAIVLGKMTIDMTTGTSDPISLADTNKLIFQALPFETANYTISVEVICDVTDTHIRKWQLTTHDVIRRAYEDRVMEYKDEVSRINAELEQKKARSAPELGIPPTKAKQIILTELKKHCIAIFRRNWFENTSAVRYKDDGSFEDTPPKFDFDKAITTGNTIRFLEQAIEWNQMQYAFYPYFWANDSTWTERFKKDDPDYEFQQFMQAGAARVVVPIRPGFQDAFNYFLVTKEVWNGEGKLPPIGDPLYLSIADELRELTGGTLDSPEPEGDPWEVRVPTNLILLRDSPALPSWSQDPEGSWNWVAESSPSSSTAD